VSLKRTIVQVGELRTVLNPRTLIFCIKLMKMASSLEQDVEKSNSISRKFSILNTKGLLSNVHHAMKNLFPMS